ncbi:MAG: bifunctional 5,10-methylenetetrahydrofolate dehydrogenase/5,10-methenyltetrahydrofolate cyclohydrolase [Thermoplasmata archaeon]|nr:bifunctional 5,10-methylenetetrahydrofolate dehydrogenase/5,10-methenyltetrahydrofolate cyclohydrolase [Thermoplasmata archaeon]
MLIDGRKIAKEMEEKIRKGAEGKEIKIITIVVDGNEETWLFAKLKDKACKRVGYEHEILGFEGIEQKELEKEIEALNQQEEITGINIQLPLPKEFDYVKLVEKIDVRKDFEGMHPYNIGKTLLGKEEIVPCTPKAILKIIDYINIDLQGKDVVIINHSNIIGKPLAMMLLKRNASVAICHEYTKNLATYTKKANIVITATGVKGLIKDDMVGENVILIDAGIKKEGDKIFGDVDKKALEKAMFATPVPRGVGPVTIASMLENCLIAYEKIHKGE